jgi:hypothetical protein
VEGGAEDHAVPLIQAAPAPTRIQKESSALVGVLTRAQMR